MRQYDPADPEDVMGKGRQSYWREMGFFVAGVLYLVAVLQKNPTE